MGTYTLPANGFELIGFAILVLGGLIQLRLQQKASSRQLAAATRKIDDMHEQVRNDHPVQPNLRHDLDATRDSALATHAAVADIHAIVRDVQDRQIAQSRDITGMRTDISGVRADLTGVSRELHDERQRSIETDASLWRAINSRSPTTD